MKKEPSEPTAKKKKEPRAAHHGPVDGFLIPESRRRQSVYKHHPIFRSTLLILFMALLMGGFGGYRWHLAKRVVQSRTATQQMLLAESERLQNQNLLLKTTKERYRELDILRKQLRIPLTPVLDAVEKTIPKEISINGFDFRCTPLATTGPARRKGEIALLVYIPNGVQSSDPVVAQWPEKLFEKMTENGLKGVNPQWGAPQELIIPKTRQRPEIRGVTRLLTYQIELLPQNS